jgi:hypothetical protein
MGSGAETTGVIVFFVMLALVVVGLAVKLASPRDLDYRDRRRGWFGASRS